MSEWRLFEEGTVPEWTTPAFYFGRERAPHLEQDLHRPRLFEAAAQVVDAYDTYSCTSVVDLGAGDGGLLSLLLADPDERFNRANVWGYDLQPENIAGARERDVPVFLGDVVAGFEFFSRADDAAGEKLPLEWGDLAVATEVLEHLVDPHQFVRTIAEHCQVLVASSPRTERPGSAYAYHAWAFDEAGYRELLEQAGFEVVRQEPVGMFQVVTGIKKDNER